MDWISIEKFLNIHEMRKEKRWSWVFNSRCKYVTLKIDMRDGHCLMFDRDKNPITIEILTKQIGR